MHKRVLKILILLCFMLSLPVYAACTYQEQADLNREVANIKVTYEEMEGVEIGHYEFKDDEEIKYNYFSINILNLSDNFYLKYSNNVDKTSKTYYSSDAVNGIIKFDWKNLKKVTTMTFKVYSSSKTGCKDQLYRTIYLTVPRFNTYYDWSICQGREKLSVCDKYVTTEEVEYDEFVARVLKADGNNSGSQTDNNTTTPNNGNVTNNIKLYICGGIVLLIIIVTIIALTGKKRKQL